MFCRTCGRSTGDRHGICWRCRRGLPVTIVRIADVALVCQCPNSDPVRLGGIWAALDALECSRCGRPVFLADRSGSPGLS